MGVRISIYAIDVPRFEAFIDQSVATALSQYSARGSDPERTICWSDAASEHSYGVAPGEPIKYESQGRWTPLTTGNTEKHLFLAAKVRDYLRSGTSYTLLELLECLSRFPPEDYVQEITTGYRRWWIGSLLDFAGGVSKSNAGDFDRFVLLCQKILRGRDCGTRLPARDIRLADFNFPVLPVDDPDLSIGVWSNAESKFALDFLRRIEDQSPKFKRPRGPVGIAPETDEEWDLWVHQMIRQLLVIGELNFVHLNVLTFIDS